jgi:hypothetical protein
MVKDEEICCLADFDYFHPWRYRVEAKLGKGPYQYDNDQELT